MPKKLEIHKGDEYNRLTIIKEIQKTIKRRYFLCECICGNKLDVALCNITGSNVKSCGCLQKEQASKANTKHGMRFTRIYEIWKKMRHRCNGSYMKGYENYGGRGITYDVSWETFENFYKDMKDGYSDDLSIDRIDNNGNYCKNNCRWATKKQQARNRRNNIMYKGKPFIEWCEELNLDYNKIRARLHIGWSIEQALELIPR